MNAGQLDEAGSLDYVLAYELAISNLALGTTVIADCVNPLSVTREAWRDEVLRREYEAWTSPRLVIDSAFVSASEAANLIFERSSGRTAAT